jgi:hypothetical protein
LEHFFERREPDVLVEPLSVERTVLPRPHFQLADVHRLLDIDTCFGEALEMFFPSHRVNEMESFISLVEAIFDERAKHPVLLVGAVKESANVTLAAENAASKLHGMVTGCHI